jgi:ribosomal protein L11 methyltransferase
MPYRVDLTGVGDDVLDRLVELGALDLERVREGGIAALMPDGVTPERLAQTLGVDDVQISRAAGRDADSVWVLNPRSVRVGRLRIAPAHAHAHAEAEPNVLRLIDGAAFGTGLHPTTALCLETLDDALQNAPIEAVLDVGTGSGILALAALILGVPRATAVDVDEASLAVAADNARINGLSARAHFARGGPDAVTGTWPLVVANVLAAALVEMAPVLVRRVGHHGRLVLSGVPHSTEQEVGDAYRRLGMRVVDVRSRAGWVALALQASW